MFTFHLSIGEEQSLERVDILQKVVPVTVNSCPKTIGQRGDLLGHCDHRRDGKGQLLLPDSHCRVSSADRHAEEAVISA